ncbi:hypothetical protein SELMODRAFT_139961 [Selaginella moellendorffii]|nr:hypothetical protein SELMODRAFT_139961 [Selaginella moellendorffii]
MKSVQSIQKITKAMKMVASSKLRQVQARAEKSRGVWQPFTALLGDAPDTFPKKTVLLCITSDRGLCGGINSSVVRFGKAMLKVAKNNGGEDAKFVVLGEKGKVQIQRDSKQYISLNITELVKYPLNFTQVSVMADEILKNVEYDAIKVIFNKFASMVKFYPSVTTILAPGSIKTSETGTPSELDLYEIEGPDSKEEALQNLSEFQFAAVLFNALLENASSEESSRMTAMDNSSKNASDMLQKLTLKYNRTRQASITTELIEIISGAAALEAAK